MKKKIIALCILATLTLTACTGKEPPIVIVDDESNINSSVSSDQDNSSSSEDVPNQEVDSSTEDVSSQENTPPAETDTGDTEKNGYEEMPQNVITYFEENTEKLQYELIDTPAAQLEYTNKQLHYIYDSYYKNLIDIGAVLDITNESTPTLIYLQKENLNGSHMTNVETGETAPLEVAFAIKGGIIGVKFDDNSVVTEFYTLGDKPELYDVMIKQAYKSAGLAPD